ncbi:MAG: ATP-binding protein [Ancalomicrobiaceae bacterium]|nr:ATP-binding protein [Ancalomicrobiaceae bacterium]
MGVHQRIGRVRRDYNKWVANQTLEDYALRFTAKLARRWSSFRVGNTAIGSISFLALEAIGGAITLTYGFTNAISAILVVGTLLFLTGFPISYYAARNGVDIDLLTRGAGFGYLGSTITSLIYASFTFIFFAIEATILAKALEMSLGLPENIGLILCALVVIPLVTYGFTFISRFQLWTQPVWIALHLIPFIFIAIYDHRAIEAWTHYTGRMGHVDDHFDIMLFGAASSVVFALIAQIAEQVDFLRFLPSHSGKSGKAWWVALVSTGPGWAVLGTLKLCAGSFLAYLALRDGVAPIDTSEPTHMYAVAFSYVFHDPAVALGVTAVFVVVSQLKINVTNSYAGSIAWSNFFSRLTHSHPGRVVWVIFNVLIALLLMEFGIYKSLEATLGLYALVAVAWVGTIVADLMINKPLGLSPRGIEFRRAHLYDINPVGFGSMVTASAVAIAAQLGTFGETAMALASYISLGTAFVVAPTIAWATRGRYYIARTPHQWTDRLQVRCCICEHEFETEDMAHCPIYAGPICSLCCTLDARCNDACKSKSRLSEQLIDAMADVLPKPVVAQLNSSLGHYLGLLLLVGGIIGTVLISVYWQTIRETGPRDVLIASAMLKTFLGFVLIAGVVCWLFVLSHESRRVAQEESVRQTQLLMQEIAAHGQTDRALQSAKEVAEAANLAKSRYLAGISHEFRTPLNTILGYAQLIDREDVAPANRAKAIRTIRLSGEHLAGLVEGLLDITKIEAGRLQLQRDVVAFPEFLEQIVDMFRLQAETKGISFDFDGAERLPGFVRIDEKRLRQILINLLSNAIKFTVSGGVRFDLRFRNEVAEIAVEDTGIGIAPEDLDRIFIPFERIENPDGPWMPGTGLGLTITKLMTEVLGGELSVRSRLGEGSRFTVRLHLPSVAAQPARASRWARVTGYVGKRLTLVVADDQASHRTLIEDLLSPLGVTVYATSDGASCLRLVEQVKPDVILLDISMPGLSGWDVARALREDLAVSAAIIMVSADAAEDRAASDAFRYHDDYIVKPFDVEAVLDKIAATTDIVWTHDGVPMTTLPSEALPSEPAVFPPRTDLEELLNLCRIGFVRGVTTKIDELGKRYPQTAVFLGGLATLAADIQLDTLTTTLEAALNELNAATPA